MTNIIETFNLSKKYGDSMCVKDLDIAVPKGAVYGFLGPNGAGKTTTMKMILHLVRPSCGKVSILGKEMSNNSRLEILKDIGSLIESPSYYGHLTGQENLKIISTLKGVEDSDIDRVLKIVRLEKQRDKIVNKYSLGMKQRLGLACALLGNPKLLILDEPTNGLDPAGIQEIRDLIRSLPQKFDMTVMVSSHLLGEIDQMATHVGIINRGELIFQDSVVALHEENQPRIVIKTLDNSAAANILAGRGVPVEAKKDAIVFPLIDKEDLAGAVAALIQLGVGVYRIEEQKRTLEDIFLQMTGMAVSL